MKKISITTSFRAIFHYVVIVVIGMSSFSCNYFRNVKLLTGGSIQAKNYVQTIPFEYKKGLIVIEGRVNSDGTPRQFIFDTGAFNSKIEAELADSLGLKTIATKENSTAAGVSQQIEVTRLDSLQLGDVLFRHIGAGKLNYAPTSASPCIADDGIIGANLIKLAHWKIDYKNQELVFSDSPLSPPKEVEQSSLSFKRPLLSGVPEIELKVGGRTVEGVLFDAGYNGGLVLPAQFASVFESETETKVIDRSTTGIYGSKTDTIITKELAVTLGDFSFPIPVEFSSNGKALLGNDVLEHFDVYINYSSKKITLTKTSEITVPFGVAFIPGVLNDSLWVVDRTSADLTISLGDTLQFINGKRPRDVFQNHCEYVMKIGEFLRQEMEIVTTKGEKMTISLLEEKYE